MLNRGKNIRLFRAEWMERISHVHPAIPACLFLPLVVLLLARSARDGVPLATAAGMAFAGLAAWTLAEYLTHRLVFHFTPRGPVQKRVAYIIHGIHHDDPHDATRLVMPPIISLLLTPPVYGLCASLFGHALGPVFFAGFTLGYLWYDYTHFYLHHGRPASAVGRFLKRHHLRHHYAHDGVNFGVSNPFWDIVFGTLRRGYQE
ncbi:MAG: sterol desaturase family protein, partial [Deltaproteobacteria bacterium]|nr:sterol desaturase family protein [Deltaproteobacteria bacterium]